MPQFLFFKYIGQANLILSKTGCAVEACIWSEHKCLAFPLEFAQEPFCKGLRILNWQLCDAVECPLGHWALHAFNTFQSGDEGVATVLIFLQDFFKIGFWRLERTEAGHLGMGG